MTPPPGHAHTDEHAMAIKFVGRMPFAATFVNGRGELLLICAICGVEQWTRPERPTIVFGALPLSTS